MSYPASGKFRPTAGDNGESAAPKQPTRYANTKRRIGLPSTGDNHDLVYCDLCYLKTRGTPLGAADEGVSAPVVGSIVAGDWPTQEAQ
jgi:hypothetical protein